MIRDVAKGDRGLVFADGKQVEYCTRAKVGLNGWVEVFVLDDSGKPKINRKKNAFLRAKRRCKNVDFVGKNG